jgi:hypothetical protein
MQEGEGGGKPAVKTKDGVVDESSEGEIGKYFDDFMPDLMIAVLFDNLVIEAVGPSEGGRLVIASQKYDAGGTETLEREEIADGFD